MQVQFTTVQVAAYAQVTKPINNISYHASDIAAKIAKALCAGFPERFTTGEIDETFLAYYYDLEILVSEVVRVGAGSKAVGCHDKLNQVIVMFTEFPVMVYQNEDMFYEALTVAFTPYFRFSCIESGFVLTKLW